MLISLPAIFRGIGLNPLAPGNVSYLLWMLMGYLVVTAVLVVPFGRLGDMFGRVRIYNLGLRRLHRRRGRAVVRPVPPRRRRAVADRLAGGPGRRRRDADGVVVGDPDRRVPRRTSAAWRSGVNMVAAVAGSFLGLLIGGVLSEWHWRAIFWVGVPIGILGTIWSMRSLQELGVRTPGRLDWAGTLTFGVGLTVLLTGITYGIQPYGDSTTGWTNPWVLGAIVVGLLLLVAFCFIELRVGPADGRHPAVPVGVVRHGQPRRADVLDGPRRPAVHAHHLAAGHLASAARLQLRVHAAVGRHLHAADDGRASWSPGRSPARCPTASARGRSPSAACC